MVKILFAMNVNIRIKYTCLLILIIVQCHLTIAQNLVPNPSFEIYNNCPGTFGSLAYSPGDTSFPIIANWCNPTLLSTSDYFNTCSDPSTLVSVPSNEFGYQYPRTGNAYIGMYGYEGNISMTIDNYREYAVCKLSTPLIAGHQYFVSYYAVRASELGLDVNHIAIEKMGAYLSNSPINDSTDYYLSYTPQIINSTGYIVDTDNWKQICGVYTAIGGEQWLTIGHFYDSTMPLVYEPLDSDLTMSNVNAYLYIDDASVFDMGHPIITSSDTSICMNSLPITIHGNVFGSPYQWNNGDTSAIISVDTGGVYWVRTWNDSIYFVDTLKVTLIANTSHASKVDTSICPLSLPIIIHSSIPSSNYIWSTGDSTASISIDTSGVYWVKNTDACNVYIDTINVHLIATDSVFTAKDTLICRNALPISLSVHTGLKYHWNTSDTTAELVINHSGTYWCNIIAAGCISYIDTIIIDTIPPQKLSIGNDTIFCNSGMISANNSYAIYAWSTSANTAAITVTQSGLYVLTATDSCGNIMSDTINITVQALPQPIVNDTTICLNTKDVILNVSGDSLRWYMPSSDVGTIIQPVINTSDTGIQILYVTASNYCGESSKWPISITVEDKPYLMLQRDTTLCIGDLLYISPVSDATKYRWSSGDTVCCITIASAGNYNLCTSNTCGSTTDSLNITEQNCDKCIWVPDAFTPNGDGKNDRLNIITHCILDGYHIRIYNRWGQIVFESYNVNNGWNGTYDKKQADIGTYYYLIETNSEIKKGEKNILKGNITLIR